MTLASWYGPGFIGQRTASGEVYHESDLTAASRSLPLGSRVRVTNLKSGRSVVVRINDRGPYVHGRGIDLSQRAARRIGLNRSGIARVSVRPLGTARPATTGESDDAAPASGSPPRQYRDRHRYAHQSHREHAATRTGRRSRTIVANPVGRWIMAVMR